MKKSFFQTFLLIASIALLSEQSLMAQKSKEQSTNPNSLSINVAKVRFTTGDLNGLALGCAYSRTLNRKFDIGLESFLSKGSAQGIFINKGDPAHESYNFIGVEEVNPLKNVIVLDEIYYKNIGLDQLETKTQNTFQAQGTLVLGYKVFEKRKSSLSVNSGIGFTFVNREYISTILPGKFTNSLFFPEPVRVNLIIPTYLRFYDWGYKIGLAYNYKVNQNFEIGITANRYDYFNSDIVYNIGLSAKSYF